MRRMIRRLVLWAVPELAMRYAPPRTTIYVVGDPFDESPRRPARPERN